MSIPNESIIREIHQRSDYPSGAVAYLSTMHRPIATARGKWTDHPYDPIAPLPLKHQPHEYDLFFSPLVFQGKRSNESVCNPGVLFADLDSVRSSDIPITPSILWRTSKGNLQAVWYVEDPENLENYDAWSNLNKRLTRWCKADPGGWMGSKVLRVPGSVNWKRRDFGEVVDDCRVEYKVETLQDMIPSLTPLSPYSGSEYPTPQYHVTKRTELIVASWDKMSLRGRNMLTKEKVGDRSLHIVRTAYELVNSGLEPRDVFNMLWVAPWNKWRTDRWMPQQLWDEVIKATEQ